MAPQPLWSHGEEVKRLLENIAASLVSFFAGYALHTNKNQPTAPLEAQVVQVQHDTIMQVQTVRDTVYQTRIVTKNQEPLLVKSR